LGNTNSGLPVLRFKSGKCLQKRAAARRVRWPAGVTLAGVGSGGFGFFFMATQQ